MALAFKKAEDLKPVIGAYASMARNNAYLTVMDIMDQIHIKQKELGYKQGKRIDPESHIWMLDLFPKQSKLLPEQEKRAAKLLRHHFPFLNLTADLKDSDNKQGVTKRNNATYEDLCNDFLAMVQVITHLRDINLHYKINDEEVTNYYYRRAEKRAGNILRDVLKAAPRKIKDRYKGTTLLDEKSLSFFTEHNYLRQGRMFTFNPQWAFNPQRAPLPSEETVLRDKVPFFDKNTGRPVRFERLSTFGEILLVALFTERRYISDLLQDCGLDNNFAAIGKDGMMSQQRIIREIISAYSVRLPERKLDIDAGSTQVMLDMLNELSRCPSELYDVLPEDERKTFDIVGRDGTQTFMKRYSDRYVPLILRYFDTTEEFKRIRFQINTGLLRYEFHGPAEYMDGVSRPRIIQVGINGYGRIQEMESFRTKGDTYYGLPLLKSDGEGNKTEMPYITDSYARYVLNGDLIGMSISGDITPKVDAVSNGTNIKYHVHCPQPDCWLSRYELPAMAFYTYLSRKYHIEYSAEDLIGDVVQKYRSFFSGVADGSVISLDGTGIPRKNIPEKLVSYLTGTIEKANFSKYKEGVVNKMIHETERLLSRLAEEEKMMVSRENRIGKKSFVCIRPGKLADYLAEDIVRFQSYLEGCASEKLTGQQYSILQGMIATFDGGLIKACRKAGLLDGNTAHPFLSQVFYRHGQEMKSTVDFYRAYLEERLAYLKSGVPDNAAFLHRNRAKWSDDKNTDYYRALALRYVKDEKTGEKVGIFLPRGLFDQAVREIIMNHCPKTAKIIEESERANMAFIILSFFENELEDQNQGFYFNEGRLHEYGFCKAIQKEIKENGFRRLSHIMRSERDTKATGLYYNALCEEACWKDDHKAACFFDENTKMLAGKLRHLYKMMCENEKTIRRFMVQDITLFLLARSLVRIAGNSVNLRNVGPEGNGILDQRVNVTTRYKHLRISQKGIRIKDYGEIYKVLKDKRIDSLLKSQGKDGGEEIQLEDIKEELVTYNRKRVPIVKMVQNYEKSVYQANESHFSKLSERFGFKEILDADNKSRPLKKEAIRQVRNAFSHNSYPESKIYEGSDAMQLFQPDLPNIAKEIHDNTGKLIYEDADKDI